MQSVNDPVFVHMEIEGVVGVCGVVWVAVLRFIPADDLTHILIQGLAFCNVDECKYTFAVHTRATHLHPTACRRRGQ
ncbi:MAG: hypothetical protein RL686_1617 [Pseudomonadota bacterium]